MRCCWRSLVLASACLQVMKISHLRDAKGRQPPAALIRVEVNDDFFRTRAIPTRNGTDYVYLVRGLPAATLTRGECHAWPGPLSFMGQHPY